MQSPKHLRKTQPSKRTGFSFIEIMVVIIIIGLLATIVGVNVLPSVDEAKIKTSQTNIRSLEAALDLYRLHNGTYPTTEQGLDALMAKPEIGKIPTRWNGPYLKNPIPKDGWEQDYQYGSNGREYEILSLGSDGVKGGTEDAADISSKYF